MNFHLDKEFNEVIMSRHRDHFSYDSFSEGERARIDLALLLTWREIGRRRNSVSTNLLILDECFDSSLDGNGAEDLMRLLRTMGHGVVVISHRNEIGDGFDGVTRFRKVDGFTTTRN